MLLAVAARIKYTDKRHPKVHYCDVIFNTRKYIKETGLVHEYEYYRVKAWVGDNDTIHLLAPLPNENDFDINLKNLFQVKPHEEDLDEKHRLMILGEV